jgi:hypothetical protein
MPSEWSQRLRQLSDMPRNRETLARLTENGPIPDRFRPRSGPVSPATPPAYPFTDPLASAPNPFSATPYPQGASIPAAPSVSVTPASAPARPTAVHVAFYALLSAAALTLALAGLGVYAITELRDTFDNVLKIDKSGTAAVITSGYADNTEIALLVAAAALGAVLAVCYLFVARAIWKGRSWPRRASPFLAVLSLPALFIGHIAIIAVLAGIIAAAACWMPSARAFATQTRAYAAAQRAARRGAATT